MSIKRLFYTIFLYFVFPLVSIRLLMRSRTNKDYRLRWTERLGFANQQAKKRDDKSLLWVHAVSVGEVIAVKPLILAVLNEFPDSCLLVTTTTPTGSDRVKDIFSNQIQDQQLIHVYFPYDLLGSISRFISAYKPKILIVVETEIWPNLYAKCKQQNIPVVMVNARLSDKSMKSYMKIKGLVAETLSNVNVIAVRSDIDEERFTKLGANFKQIEKVGNIKYDLKIDQAQIDNGEKYKQIIKNRSVLVAASTHDGEETKVLITYKFLLKQFPNLLLVLIPRHPERFDDVYDECLEQLPEVLNVVRHSEFKHSFALNNSELNVIVGDSMGEMQMWYSLADLVYIGGSLVKTGGHNPLEATIFGVPVFSGPHMFNFEDIATKLIADELLTVCDDESDLFKKTSVLLENLKSSNNEDSVDEQFKVKADKFMQQHRGVTTSLVSLVSKNLTH